MKCVQVVAILFLVILSCKKEHSSDLSSENEIQFQYITKIQWHENQDSISLNSGGEALRFAKKDLPLKTAMVVPTSVISYLDELNLTDKITGVSQIDFIFNPEIHQNLKANKIIEIGTFNELFIEKILVSKPDVFITTSGPTLAKFHELLKREGINILYIDEYEEPEPLAKAEYVKIFGKLFGKEKEADDLFKEIEKNYLEIHSKVKESSTKNPAVIANQMYGDVWYMPGGKSFQAILFKDAGGDYLWSADTSAGTLNFSFESVFEKAHNADIWMNAGDFPSKAALLATYPHYEWFAAFKSGNIYNWSKRKSATGANDYFETGTARPDWVLKDLAAIFHSELFPGHELFFYERLK